ncbi:hypothetical protein HYALB_00013782 [Hymenoscyphus albidus]|uniref:Homing endonuclease LAGLIDADG domain-containing protein n=1 Tax=Hymenoscyphus albidus TaxID=595503 RepID=A0A9N9LY75_9HELO|nr:hypothetical protein HYALB_00013782 [Hymenoscyphus albidus]
MNIVESRNITEDIKATVLPTIGTVSIHALKKGNKIRLNKKEYLSIPSSFIAFLVGFIDGDGYIQVTRSTKGFITIKLVISIHLDDISTLQYMHSVLKIGKITVYSDVKNPRCKLIINRTDLQEVFFPLLIHHGIFFLTDTRRAQFDLAMLILKQDIKVYDEIPFVRTISSLHLKEAPQTAEAYRIHVLLFEAFKLVFNTNRKIDTEKGLYNQFSVCSKADIQTVINFFSFKGFHPLIGLKSLQYLK